LHVTEQLPKLEDILKLRKNLQMMKILCNHFLPCVVGKKWWKMQILAGKSVNNVAMVSDEAFVLLVLENIWDNMMKVNIDEYYCPKKERNTTTKRLLTTTITTIHLRCQQTMKTITKVKTWLLGNGQVHGVDLVGMEDGVLKD